MPDLFFVPIWPEQVGYVRGIDPSSQIALSIPYTAKNAVFFPHEFIFILSYELTFQLNLFFVG